MKQRHRSGPDPEGKPLDDALLMLGVEPERWATRDSDLIVDAYIELAKMREDARTWLKRVEAQYDALEPEVCNYFERVEKEKDTRRGRTVYLSSETWPKIKCEIPDGASKEEEDELREEARQRLIEALASDPTTAHLVRAAYSSNTLRSFILNDCPEDPETMERVIPEHLEPFLGVSERPRAKVVRSK